MFPAIDERKRPRRYYFVTFQPVMSSPAEYYNQQKDKYTLLLNAATKELNRIAMFRLWSAIAALALGIWAFSKGGGWQWGGAGICAALFLVLVRIFHRLSDRRTVLVIHLTITEREIQSLSGDNSAFPAGIEYIDIAHPYSYDLDLFGKGSVYQALCRAVTVGGAVQLAQKLSSLVLTKESVKGRQEIIKELSAQPDFLQNFRVAGLGVAEGPRDQALLTQWLVGEDMFVNNRAVRITSIVMPLTAVAFIIWSIVIGGFYSGLIPLFVINLTILGNFQKKIKQAGQQIGHSAQLADKYEGLLMQVAGTAFTAPWLQKSSAEAKSMLESIANFKKVVHLFDSRSNGLTGPLMNGLFLFDFYCLIKLETWRRKNSKALLDAIAAMIEMDVYVGSSVYGFNHPEYIYPDIATSGREISAKGLRHPLLSAKSAVGNDFTLGRAEQFYLLTGANMTGKSTFIRTVGVCNVLGNIGLPLPAKEFSMPLLDLYTSMRITDSVQDDISYFRAELNRIKQIMDKVKHTDKPYLVLLDEPLRGTNSTDKQQGTRSIVETLLTYHAIGIVATHDTGLCDMELNYSGKVSNYHFESRVEATGLSFDFRIKPGGSTSNNATILMRQMGIIN